MAQDSNIRIRVEAQDGGASAILKRITELLGQLNETQARGLSITAKETSEAERLAAAQRRSEAAIRSHANAVRQQIEMLRAATDAFRASTQANSQLARAQQQATQAAIQDARLQRQAVADQTRAVQTQTQAQVNASNAAAVAAAARTRAALQENTNQTRAAHAATQAMLQESREQAAALNAQARAQQAAARAQQQATQAQTQAAAQSTRAAHQQTAAQVQGATQTARALGQQTAAQLAASRAAQQAANNAANAARQQAAATIAQSRVQTAAINAQARVQAAQIRAQQQATRAAQQHQSALTSHTVSTHNNATAIALLTRRLVQLAATLSGARLFVGFVREGFEFNETINQATLGIGALITAQAKLYDGQGRLLQGTRALNAAMDLSAEQVTKLRIAGLQTAATTEQLVTAMQQAVGPGLRSGLNLDQIRQFTVDITQAAAAIGLPMHQLNEEVRSLLAGTITYNTRIAKTLGITNQMVANWKAQGVFAQELLNRFNAFNLAGQRAMGNMTVLLSNLKEAMQVFAGEATKPLFDRLRKEGQAALNSFFDFDRGQISTQFQGIVDIAREVFGSIGSVLGNAIKGAVRIAGDLSQYFEENRVAIDGVIGSAKDLAVQFARVLGNVIKITLSLIDAGIKSGFLQGVLQALANITKFLADNIKIMEIAFASGVIFKGISAIAALASLTPAGAAIALVAGAVTLLTIALAGMRSEEDREAEASRIIQQQHRNTAVEIHKLTVEYDVLRQKLASGKLSAAAHADAQQRLRTIIQQLVQYAPAYSRVLTQWGTDAKQTAEKVKQLQDAQERLLQSQFAIAQTTQKGLQARQRELQTQLALHADLKKQFEDIGDERRSGKEQDQIDDAKKALDELSPSLDRAREDVGNIVNAMAVLLGQEKDIRTPTVIKPDIAPPDPKKNNDFRQMIEAAIKQVQDAFKEAKQSLDTELDHQEISFADYVNTLMSAERQAINAEIQLRRTLLAHTTDPGEQAKIQESINELVNRRIGLQEDAKRKLTDLEKQLNDELQQIDVQRLRQEERNGDARRIELEQQYDKLRRTLAINGKSQQGIDAFINIEVARAQLEDLNRIIGRATSVAESNIQRINELAAQGMLSTREQSRALADAYEGEINAIRRALPELRHLAEASHSEDAILQVQQLEQELEKLRQEQRLVTSEFARYTEVALGGFQSGVADAFAQVGTTIEETHRVFDQETGKMIDQTTRRIFGLRDLVRSVGVSILQSLQRQVGQDIAQNLTSLLRGALGKVGINLGGDMAPALLQQRAATVQFTAATTTQAAATQFAASIGLLQSIAPTLFATTQAGTLTGSVATPVGQEIGRGAVAGLDQSALIAAGTTLNAAGVALQASATAVGASTSGAAASLTGAAASLSAASATMGTALIPPATSLSAAAAALSAAALTLRASGSVAAGANTTSQLLNFGSSALQSGAFSGGVPSMTGGLNAPRFSRVTETVDRSDVVPSFTIPTIASPTTAAYSRNGPVSASMAVRSAPTRAMQPEGAKRVEVLLRSTDSHVLRVLESDPGVSVQMTNVRRNRRALSGLLNR